MQPFPPPDLVWAPGETRWHCYALPDLARDAPLADLIGQARDAAQAAAGEALAPVTDEWVHATVHMVSLPSAALGPGAIDGLARSLTHALADVPAFSLTVGPPWAGDGSVLLGLTEEEPDRPWTALSAAVGRAIGDQFGPSARQYVPGPPHLSLAYCAKPIDSGLISSALIERGLSNEPQLLAADIRMEVSAIHLVDVRQDAAAHTYTWNTDTAISIPLSGKSQP